MDLKRLCVEEDVTISEGIKRLDEAGEKVLLCDKNEKLTGIITDGDIRRWILRNESFEKSVDKLMHRNPRTVRTDERQKARGMMLDLHLEAIPVVNSSGIPVTSSF